MRTGIGAAWSPFCVLSDYKVATYTHASGMAIMITAEIVPKISPFMLDLLGKVPAVCLIVPGGVWLQEKERR